MEMIDPFVFRLSIFVLAIFVGYFVVWSVTPALHTPLMSVTNAISSVIIVGALIAAAVTIHPKPEGVTIAVNQNGQVFVDNVPVKESEVKQAMARALNTMNTNSSSRAVTAAWTSKSLGLVALILASVNIFGGFLVTSRMLAMYRKKEKK
jgi:NAD(P) transhydrogenase subunit alpha